MKNTALIGVTLQDFFPLIAKLAQQIRLPVTVLAVETTGPGLLTETGLVEVATITVAPSGSVSAHTTLVNPEQPIQLSATNAHGLRAADVHGAPKFPIVYDSLSRSFASSLIVGFNSLVDVVPVIYGNMVRYGLPIMSARHQLDLQAILSALGAGHSQLPDVAKQYSVTPGTGRRSAGNALTMARILETMLWRHGSEAILACLVSTTTSYLTPEDVIGTPAANLVAAPAPAPASNGKIRPVGSRPFAAKKPSTNPSPWLEPLKALIAKTINAHGVVRPLHLPEIASAMDWSESRTSIEIGRLLTRGKIPTEPFLIPEQQAILSLHLPIVLEGMKDVKLKAVRDSIKAITGHELEYIQIRLGLKSLGVWHD